MYVESILYIYIYTFTCMYVLSLENMVANNSPAEMRKGEFQFNPDLTYEQHTVRQAGKQTTESVGRYNRGGHRSLVWQSWGDWYAPTCDHRA